ncbi:MAG: hypothetical protein QXE66_07005 [Desulfurococcaceae archaeon]
MKTDSILSLIAIIILVTSLFSVPSIVAHTPGTTLSYEVTAKIDYVETGRLDRYQTSSNFKFTILLQGEINYRVVSLNRDGITVHIELTVKDVRFDAEPQEIRASVEEFISSSLIGRRESSTFKIPYSGKGIDAFNLPVIMGNELGESLEQLLRMYGVYDLEPLTVVEVTTWKNIPCICTNSSASFSMEIYGFYNTVWVETRTCHDMTGMFPLSAMGTIGFLSINRGDPTKYVRVSTEYTLGLKNVDVIKGLTVRSYVVKLERGNVDIHLSGRNLSVLDTTTQGNRLVLRLTGEGLGSVVLHSNRYIEIEKVLVDSIPVEYYIDTSDGVVVIRIPVIFSERTVEIVFKEEIEGIESKKAIKSEDARDTGTGMLYFALIVILVLAVVAVVVWKLLRKIPRV